MNKEERLEIQAWLDGELPPTRAAQIANLARSDSQAQGLASELRMVGDCLKIGESQSQVNDLRDFYWSQIELQIEAEEPIPPVLDPKLTSSPVAGIMRWAVPAGSLAAIFALIITFDALKNINDIDIPVSDTAPSLSQPAPIPSANTGHTESSGMMEDEKLDGGLEVFLFEGSQGSGNLNDPEDPNSLPESIENPER
jgi:hypothetical protein